MFAANPCAHTQQDEDKSLRSASCALVFFRKVLFVEWISPSNAQHSVKCLLSFSFLLCSTCCKPAAKLLQSCKLMTTPVWHLHPARRSRILVRGSLWRVPAGSGGAGRVRSLCLSPWLFFRLFLSLLSSGAILVNVKGREGSCYNIKSEFVE